MHSILATKEVVFFDMGNTLLDFHKRFTDEEKDAMGLKEMQLYLNRKGIVLSLDELKSRFLDPFYGQFHRRIKELVEIDVMPYIDQLGDFTSLEKDELVTCFYSPYLKYVQVNEGALDLLKQLKNAGKIIGVISNCFLPSFLYKKAFEMKRLSPYIDGYTFSYSLMLRKPRRELFLSALNQFNVSADKTIMIGDGFKPDILGADAVGIDSIWYNVHQRPLPSNSPKRLLSVITHFNDLLKD